MNNINQTEQERYKQIKANGEYLELNILIDAHNKGDSPLNMPVVTAQMHSCSGKEVGALYMVLRAIKESLEEEYPLECAVAKYSMSCETLGSAKTVIKHKKDKEED